MTAGISAHFESAVLEYLAPHKQNFNFSNLVQNHLDISRFGPWVEQIGVYRSLEGAVVFSSGCGSAGDLFSFFPKGISRAYGIEVDSGLARLAEQRFKGTSYEDKVGIKVYDGRRLPYQDQSFDVVLSLHVIEHTKDVGLYLAELFRVLRPGGIIFLELPNRYYPVEQHTNLDWIHYFPRKVRDVLIKILIRAAKIRGGSKDLIFKLGSLRNYHIPAPRALVRTVKQNAAAYNLEIVDCFFHSHDNSAHRYAESDGYIFGRARQYTTFRIVIGKKG